MFPDIIDITDITESDDEEDVEMSEGWNKLTVLEAATCAEPVCQTTLGNIVSHWSLLSLLQHNTLWPGVSVRDCSAQAQ